VSGLGIGREASERNNTRHEIHDALRDPLAVLLTSLSIRVDDGVHKLPKGLLEGAVGLDTKIRFSVRGYIPLLLTSLK
jgi:hypothetical protein